MANQKNHHQEALNENLESTHDVTSAAQMEAEERELVIENSVEELVTYSDEKLTDEEINEERLHLKDIVPKSNQE